MVITKIKQTILNNHYARKIKREYTGGNISIISSNCLGGKLYQTLNMQYQSPFIGLFVYSPDFIELLSNLDDYLNSELRFTDHSKYRNCDNSGGNFYPIGLLNDAVELHFLQYKSENIAKNNWYRRLNRIDLNNVYIIFTDRDQCTYDSLVKFNKLPFKKKVCFTSRNYERLDSCVFLPEYKYAQSVGILTDEFYNTCRHFDWLSWLNGDHDGKQHAKAYPNDPPTHDSAYQGSQSQQ